MTGNGSSSGVVAELCAWSAPLGATATLLVREGQPLLSAGKVDQPIALQSVRKSLLSALVGIAIAAGELTLDRSLGELGIDDHPPLRAVEKSATVADLLSARSGVYLPLPDGLALPGRPARGSHPPGTHWHYSNWDFNVLGNVYERATGKSVYLAFDHHLARPLGMQDWDAFEHSRYEYRADPLGGNLTYANYTFALSARDLARFGQLHLQQGLWGNHRVIAPDWIAQSTNPRVVTGLEPALMRHYGYGWWVAGPGAVVPADAFTAWGLNGNFLTVIPSRQLVLVVLADRGSAADPRSPVLSPADYSQWLTDLITSLPHEQQQRAG